VLANVKLIAEPWDLGMGGYQVGAFPPQWSEWNDRYRSAMRRYWSGEGSLIGEVSSRMTGSADLFNHDGRAPRASVNHITVHDGFTLPTCSATTRSTTRPTAKTIATAPTTTQQQLRP
jgi:isoamylase